MRIFWGSWFLHRHEIPHPNQWGSRKVFILQNTILDNIIYAVVKGERELYLARVDFNGTQLGITNLTTDIDQDLLSASLSKANNKYFMTGTYTKSKKGGAQGIYFAQLENWQIKKQRFVNFLDLKNFTDYMSNRRKARIERKKKPKRLVRNTA